MKEKHKFSKIRTQIDDLFKDNIGLISFEWSQCIRVSPGLGFEEKILSLSVTDTSEEIDNSIQAVNNLLRSYEFDDLIQLFGQDVIVKVFKNKIVISEYSESEKN
jgi:hypothetical protein